MHTPFCSSPVGSHRRKAILLCKSLIGILLFASIIPSSNAFWDVAPHSEDEQIFAYLEEHNIITGFADGSMKPNASISRAEALTAILRSRERFAPTIVWFKDNLPEIPLFPDIEQDSWYAPFVEVAFLKGIVTGYPDGFFRPAQPLTTEEAISMIMRVYRNNETAIPYMASAELPNVPDVWFTNDINQTIDRNFVRSEHYLALGAPLRRADFFSLLMRTHIATENRLYAYIEEEQYIAPAPVFSVTPVQPPTGPPSASLVFASEKPFAISIPKLNINDLAIIHPENPFDPKGILEPLKFGVGHLFSYPGNQGKTMIYGHSSSYAWDVSEYTKIFRQINKLQPGDRIYITYNNTLYVYETTHQSIVDANDTSLFDDDGVEEIIMYTCWPPNSTKSRLAVHAKPIETVAINSNGGTGPYIE